MKKYLKDILALVVLSSVVAGVFRWVPRTFFQQDEWYFIGKYYLAGTNPLALFHVIGGVHFVPLQQLWFFLQYYLFGLNAAGFGIVSVAGHVVVGILAYVFFRKLSFRIIPSFVAAAFFILNSVSSQVVTWPLASTHGATSMVLILAACIIWRRSGVIAAILLFCAMLFKEDSVLGYMLIPAITIFFTPKRKHSYMPLIISFMMWFAVFIGLVASAPKLHGFQVTRTFGDILHYVGSIPAWVGRILMTHDTLRANLQRFLGDYAGYVSVLDNDPIMKTLSSGIAILGFCWYLVTAVLTGVPIKKIFVFPFLVALSMTPYFFSGSGGLESRYYFIAVFITSLWIAWYLDWMVQKKHMHIYRIAITYIVLLISMFGIANQPRKDYLELQDNRKRIVLAMQKIVVPSPRTVVYYIEHGDGTPFQSGVGDILLVLQARRDPAFSVYFSNYFLYRMNEEGYQKLGEKGFGYYFDKQTLKESLAQDLFLPAIVRAYSFDRDTLTLRHIPFPL